MGVRVSTRVGRHTSVSAPAWLVLLPVVAVCGLISMAFQAMVAHPVASLVIAGCVVFVAAAVVLIERHGRKR